MADPSPDDVVDDGTKPPDDEGQAPTEDVKPDDGQEPKGRTYSESHVRALRRESAGYRTKLADVEEQLQKFIDRDKSDAEKASERVAELEARATAAESKLIRYEVAADRGLDMQAADLLVGTSRDEVEASADKLAALLADRPPKAPAGFDGGARQPAKEELPPEQAHNDLLLRALGRNPST